MWVLIVVCLVFSAILSLLSVVRGVTAEKQWRNKDFYKWNSRNSVATMFLVVALVLAVVGVIYGHVYGQHLTATSNMVVGGLWLAASVYLS
jgi:uncharacterized membrane protein